MEELLLQQNELGQDLYVTLQVVEPLLLLEHRGYTRGWLPLTKPPFREEYAEMGPLLLLQRYQLLLTLHKKQKQVRLLP